jgi:hypothetical protein
MPTHNSGEVNAAVEQLAANSADVAGNNVMADGGSYASVVAAAQATAVTPNPATPPTTAPCDPATPPTTTPSDPATPPSTTPSAGSPETGGATAGDGGNHLVADLIALLQGGGQNSVSAVIADLAAVAQAAGVHNNNGVASLLSDLHAAAAPTASTAANGQDDAQANTPAPVAAASGGAADIGVHHFGEMAHHFHHMWG